MTMKADNHAIAEAAFFHTGGLLKKAWKLLWPMVKRIASKLLKKVSCGKGRKFA